MRLVMEFKKQKLGQNRMKFLSNVIFKLNQHMEQGFFITEIVLEETKQNMGYSSYFQSENQFILNNLEPINLKKLDSISTAISSNKLAEGQDQQLEASSVMVSSSISVFSENNCNHTMGLKDVSLKNQCQKLTKSTNGQFNNILNYQFKQLLGTGAFGDVYKAEFNPIKIELAVKIIRFQNYDECFSDQLKKLVANQSEVCNRLVNEQNLQFLPKTFSVFQHEETAYFVTELFYGFTLEDLLKSNKISISPQQMKYYLASLLCAIGELHGKLSTIHRDIKPDNVMILSNGTLRLIDFGCAKFLGPQIKTSSIIGAYQYFSPERFEGKYGKQADIWAFATIAYEMALGKLPFEFKGMDECEEDQKYVRLSKIIRKRNKLNISESIIDPDLKQLIELIHNANTEQRQEVITIKYLQSLKYFQDIQWDSFTNQSIPAPRTFSLIQIEQLKAKDDSE